MADEGVVVDDGIDYRPFVEATKEGDWSVMKEFLRLHSGSTKVTVERSRTALHYLLERGNIEIGELLFDETERDEDLQIEDINGNTAFACLSSNESQPAGVLKLLQRMYARSANLPNIGKHFSVPVVKASLKIGCKDTTNYLYGITHDDVLNPDLGLAGIHLLINCINIGLFG